MNELREQAKNTYNLPYEYIGEIVDNKDPLDRGRLKCKIFHINDTSSIDNLPWCESKAPLFGNQDTVGFSSAPKIGTYVYIKFLYGNPSFPVVDSYVRGDKDSSFLHTVKNLSETISGTRTSNIIGPELPPLNSSSVYPNNNVIETETAVIEIDDTSGNERISIQHKNGSYFEIRPDGTIQNKSTKDTYNITKGKLEEYIEGAVNKEIKGTLTLKVIEDIVESCVNKTITASGGFTVDSPDINLGTGGTGVVTNECVCAFTGLPHSDFSSVCKAKK